MNVCRKNVFLNFYITICRAVLKNFELCDIFSGNIKYLQKEELNLKNIPLFSQSFFLLTVISKNKFSTDIKQILILYHRIKP